MTAVWQEYGPELRERCRRWMGEQAAAEEAFSRAMTQIVLHLLPSYRTILDLRAWLLRLTYNVCMDLHRERKRRREESLEDLGGAEGGQLTDAMVCFADPEQHFLQGELESYLSHRLWELPKHLREPILRRAARQSYREIAEALGIREPNARKRVQVAREILYRHLDDYRAGRCRAVQPAARPRPGGAEAAEHPEREWRLRAFRPVVVRSGKGETDAVLHLYSSPQSLPSTRLEAAQRYRKRHPNGWRGALRMARLFRESGGLADAIPHYRSVVEQAPRRLDAWLELASSLELLARREEAAAVYRDALRWAREEVAVRYLRALEARCQGDRSGAETHLERALAITPGDPTLLAVRAEGQWQDGHPVEAVDSIEKILGRSPDDEIGLILGHGALMAAGRVLAASERSRRAAEIHASPFGLGFWIVHRCRAGHVRGEEGKKTRQLLRKLFRLDPHRAETHGCFARYHLARGEWGLAEDVLAGFLAHHPRHVQGWAELARVLWRTGKHEEAASSIRRALELAPDRRVRLLACRILPGAEPSVGTRRTIEQMLLDFPGDWLVTTAAARALGKLSPSTEVLELAREATRLQPRLPESWFLYGRLLQRRGASREAIAALEDGWRLLPEGDGFLQSTPAALLWAECLSDVGDTGGSLALYRRALDHARVSLAIDPARALVWEGQAHLGLGEPEAARHAFLKALRKGLLHSLRPAVEAALGTPGRELSHTGLRARLEE